MWEKEWTSLPHSPHSQSPPPNPVSITEAREPEFLPIGACTRFLVLLAQQEFAGTTSTDFHQSPLWPLPPFLSLAPLLGPASGSSLIILLWASDHNSCLDGCSRDENVTDKRNEMGRINTWGDRSGVFCVWRTGKVCGICYGWWHLVNPRPLSYNGHRGGRGLEKWLYHWCFSPSVSMKTCMLQWLWFMQSCTSALTHLFLLWASGAEDLQKRIITFIRLADAFIQSIWQCVFSGNRTHDLRLNLNSGCTTALNFT